MTWKVYGFMEPGDYRVYGPLPRKRWIRDVPHKKHKLNYQFKYSQRGAESNDSYNERRAIEYARWLAQRDGIDIPKGSETRVEWSAFYSTIKTRTQRQWDGSTTQRQAYCNRICAVEFGRKYKEDHYNTRKDGRRGAWTHTTHHMDVAARIDIPHWDWEPADPVESTIAAPPRNIESRGLECLSAQ